MKTGTATDALGNVYDVCLFDRDFMDNRQMVAYVLVEQKGAVSSGNGFVRGVDAEDHFASITWNEGTDPHRVLTVQPWIMGMFGTDSDGKGWETFVSSRARQCDWCWEPITNGWRLTGHDTWVCDRHFDVEGTHDRNA